MKIIKLRKGSVVVDHEVVLNISNGENATGMISQAPDQIKEALHNANCTVVCDNYISKDFRNYYTASIKDGKVICISQCDDAHSKKKNCNDGICRIMSAGPTCECKKGYWYSGADCYGPIKKDVVSAICGVLGVALLIALVALIVFVVWQNINAKRRKDCKDDQVKEWLEDDFEWPSSEKKHTLAENDSAIPNGGYIDLYNLTAESSRSGTRTSFYGHHGFNQRHGFSLSNNQYDKQEGTHPPAINMDRHLQVSCPDL
ncbi:mucin-17-like [Arapaima gigas]